MDCNGKLGLDVVCAGVDARIAAGVHRYKDLRFVSGIGAYLLSLAEQVIFRGLCRPLTKMCIRDSHDPVPRLLHLPLCPL